MNKKWACVLVLFLCLSKIYAQNYEDLMQNITSGVIDEYTRDTPPFPIVGKWNLLIPAYGNIPYMQNEPKNYEDLFDIIRFEIIDGQRARILLSKNIGWRDCTWQHAAFGAKFYINIDLVYTIKIIYYLKFNYIEKDETKNRWESILAAFKNGDNEYQIDLLALQIIMKTQTDEELESERKMLIENRVPCSTSTVPVLIGILENGVEIASSKAIITKLEVE